MTLQTFLSTLGEIESCQDRYSYEGKFVLFTIYQEEGWTLDGETNLPDLFTEVSKSDLLHFYPFIKNFDTPLEETLLNHVPTLKFVIPLASGTYLLEWKGLP